MSFQNKVGFMNLSNLTLDQQLRLWLGGNSSDYIKANVKVTNFPGTTSIWVEITSVISKGPHSTREVGTRLCVSPNDLYFKS